LPDDTDVYDSSDQASVDNAAKDAARRLKQDKETMRIWMSHPHGRDFLYRLVFETCHMGRTFTALDDHGRSDALRTYLDIGERNIGAFLDEMMRQHPKEYMTMLEEQRIEAELRETRLQKQNERKRDDGYQSSPE
jgi:hypothetical protein